jgi:hypothetical protein
LQGAEEVVELGLGKAKQEDLPSRRPSAAGGACEWASDPPSCGGPWQGACGSGDCGDCCGFWNPLRGLAHLWGYRYAPAGYGMGYDMGYDGGCDDCAESYDMYDSMEPVEEMYEETLPVPKPDVEPETSKQASVRRPVKAVKHVPASHKTTTVRRK